MWRVDKAEKNLAKWNKELKRLRAKDPKLMGQRIEVAKWNRHVALTKLRLARRQPLLSKKT